MGTEFHPEGLSLLEKVSLLQRPLSSPTPEERDLDVRHVNLSADDIDQIKPGEWLNDKIIETVLRRLTLLWPGKFFAIDPGSATTMVDIIATAEDRAERELYGGRIMKYVAMLTNTGGTGGTVLLPFNVDGNHFILVAVRPAERAVLVYDSTRGSDENNVDILVLKYMDFLVDLVKRKVE